MFSRESRFSPMLAEAVACGEILASEMRNSLGVEATIWPRPSAW
jgi:hypothetical protein